MSTTAAAILDQIKHLPPAEQTEVLTEVSRLQDRHRAWEAQQARLRAMQARHTGSGLLGRLLSERAKERSRG